MKSFGAAIAAAVLLWCAAAGRAEEPVHAAALPPESAFPAAAGCATCNAGCGSCAGHHGGLCKWLTYRPLHRTRCGECAGCCEGRWVPLYLYFLGRCNEHPCTACGGCAGCGGPACGFAGPFGAPTGVGFPAH